MQTGKPSLRNPGELINGRYAVVQIVGVGATGEVYIVTDPENDGKMLALKYLKLAPEFAAAVEFFKAEFGTMTHLNHPHIAKVYDFGWDNDLNFYFFTSELIDGFDFINSSKQMSIEQIELLLIQSLRALEYLHSHNIYHYDIKPQNILVQDAHGPSPSVKVIDFGLASSTGTDKLIGTPSYIAPEIIRRQKPDGRADLYSLGVLAYFTLTRKNPFRAKTTEETLDNHLKTTPLEPIQLNPSIPEYLSSITMKLLEKNPEDRYLTAADVIQDINFRSPRFHAIETPDTLLSYVPWEGPFIGRHDQLATYKTWLDKVDEDDDKRNIFWIRGELGTGKSRFLEEGKNNAQLMGFDTILTSEIDDRFLKKLEEKPDQTLIIIDKFDAIYQASFIALDKFIGHLNDSNLLIATSNDPDECKEIRAFFTKNKFTKIRELELANFTIKDLKEYVCSLTGLQEAPGWLIQTLHTFTGGNPLFMTETMKQMISNRLLFDERGRWKKSTIDDLGVNLSFLEHPESLLDRLEDILAPLSPLEQEITGLLSLCRKNTSGEMIKKLFKPPIEKELKKLVAKDILTYEPTKEVYFFKNVILKRACRQRPSANIRMHYHDIIADYLNKQDADEAAIDYHLGRGSHADIARETLLKGINSDDQGIKTRAINEFLERFGDTLDEDVFKVTLLKSENQIKIRNHPEAYNIYNTLMKRLPPMKSAPSWHIDLHLAIVSLYKIDKKLDEAILHIRKAEEASRFLSDSTISIIIENHKAGIELIQGNSEYAIERYIQSREEETKLNNEERLKICNNDLGFAYFDQGFEQYKLAKKIFEEDLKRFRKSGNKKRLCEALYQLGEIYKHFNKNSSATKKFSEVIKLAKEINDIKLLYCGYNGLGNILNDLANYADGIGYFERALDLALHIGDDDDAVTLMANIAVAHSNLGNNKRALDILKTALTFLERKDSPAKQREPNLCRIYLELADIYISEKQFDRATKYLDKTLDLTHNRKVEGYLFGYSLAKIKLANALGKKNQLEDCIKAAKKYANTEFERNLFKKTIRDLK